MTGLLVLFTGPPGTGKSTLAERAAQRVGGPVLGWDWAMAGMTQFEPIQDALKGMNHAAYARVGWSVLWNLATAQLRQGRSVVLDGVARDPEVTESRAVADAAGAGCIVVVTSCRDRAVHRERVEGRARAIPGWHELDWGHVAGFLDRWTPPAHVDLHLDAVEPIEHNHELLAGALDRHGHALG